VLLSVDPFSTRAIDLVPRLRAVATEAANGQEALIGGMAAENYDNREALNADTRLIVPLVLGLILLILIILLRCIVAPLYVIGTVVLSSRSRSARRRCSSRTSSASPTPTRR
jgi:uncharacterized membrane protein YdfJ with MMPL/SSD domain